MTYAQYERLNVPVTASPLAVLREAHKMLAPNSKSREWRTQRHAWYREILKHHHDAQVLYKTWRF